MNKLGVLILTLFFGLSVASFAGDKKAAPVKDADKKAAPVKDADKKAAPVKDAGKKAAPAKDAGKKAPAPAKEQPKGSK